MRYSVLFVVLVSAISAKPLPALRVKPAPEPQATLIICGPTNWGTFYQNGRAVSIEGNPSWTFAGTIRPDGRIQGIWLCEGIEREATAVYSIQPDGSLLGRWGWDARVLGNGNIDGVTSEERIVAEEREPAPIN